MSKNPRLKEYINNPLAFLKWMLFALIIGITAGSVSTAFYFGFKLVTKLRINNPWLIFFLPVGGVVIYLLYKFSGMANDKGTNYVLIAVRENESMPLLTTPLIFVSTLITHLFGGSSGREGAILQIGGSISNSIGRQMHLDDKDNRVITMCGMAAAFSALFGTPLTSAVFAMEIVSVGVMYYAAIVPCTLSAIVGLQFAKFCGVPPTQFTLSGFPELSFISLFQIIGIGILCALLSIIFCRLMRAVPKLYDRYLPNSISRAIAGGIIIIGLTLLVGCYDYNGAGSIIIAQAFSGKSKPEAFVLKMIFTTITLSAGYKGGEIVPVFFIGATFGNLVGPLLGLSSSFGAALGLVSVFCGVTNCPMTSVFLALELFGGQNMTMFALSIAVAYMLSGYSSLYSEQKIMYSKLRPVFINRNAE